MNKLVIVILIGSVLVACRQKSKQENDDKNLPRPVEKETQHSDTLSDYDFYLQSLDTAKASSVSLAAKRFTNTFANVDTLKADSAFLIFNRWYNQMGEYLNDQFLRDPNSGAGLSKENGGDLAAHHQQTADYSKNLHDNGFTIAAADGTTFIKSDPSFLVDKFSPYLSSSYKQYLKQTYLEDSLGFLKDGVLVIKPVELSERIVWRENFLNSHPAFIFKQKLLESQKEYTTFLMDGIDNSPAKGAGEHLNPDYLQAYEYIIATYPQSRLAMIIKPYYNAIKNNEVIRVKKLLRRLKRQGIIYDYSA